MNASPTNSALQSDQRSTTTTASCCCFPVRRRMDEVKEKPFQIKRDNENDVPTLQQPQIRTNVQRSSTKDSVATVYDLPPGWKAVTSRSRPDRTAFLNEFTGERISWVPTEPASTIKGEIRRSKRKSRINNDRDSVNSSGSDNTAVRASFDQRNSKTTLS
jgi:hypothetical protein